MSEKRGNAYVPSDRTAAKWHNMPSDQITHWFQVWGIIGKRRQVVELVKPKPVFDRGPGAKLSSSPKECP